MVKAELEAHKSINRHNELVIYRMSRRLYNERTYVDKVRTISEIFYAWKNLRKFGKLRKQVNSLA